MIINELSPIPIFTQIAENIKADIVQKRLKAHDKVYSTNELASLLGINPATALKGLNSLIDGGILYKKRGIGMFVSESAYVQLIEEKREALKVEWVYNTVKEAKKLEMDLETLLNMISEIYKEA